MVQTEAVTLKKVELVEEDGQLLKKVTERKPCRHCKQMHDEVSYYGSNGAAYVHSWSMGGDPASEMVMAPSSPARQ